MPAIEIRARGGTLANKKRRTGHVIQPVRQQGKEGRRRHSRFPAHNPGRFVFPVMSLSNLERLITPAVGRLRR